jgi:nucleoside-diphosphate-sugar epimerase
LNAVVTGCAGLVGSRLARRILDEGGSVTGVDNFLTGSRRNVEALLEHPGFQFHEADVCVRPDLANVAREDRRIDVLFHLASPASPTAYARHPLKTLAANSHGTEHALDLAAKLRARFILASTSEIYGEPEEHPQTERYWGHVNSVGPRSCYDESKRFAETLVAVHTRLGNVDAAIARIFNTYGPGMQPDDGRVIPTFLMQALSGARLTIEGSGSQTRAFMYVDDLVEGLIRLAVRPLGGHLAFNLGNPHETTIAELVAVVSDVLGRPLEVVYGALPQDCPTRRAPDIELAKAILGWQPCVSLRQGIERTIEYFRELVPAAAQ